MRCFMGCDPTETSKERFYVVTMPELTIYGHTVDEWVRDNYPEDWDHVEQARERGYEWGCFHSVACPNGEIGSQIMSACVEVPFEMFVAARSAEWPHLRGLPYSLNAPAAAVWAVDDRGVPKKVWDSLGGDAA